MGCGSAKISLTHRRGGGKRRDGNTSDDSDTEGEEGAGGGPSGQHGRHHQHQLRGSHKVRPASLVTSTSVDSQLLKTSSTRPKITTSFSQNDFSTTTSVSGTSRIRVTLSHDGSLLEVETETFETLEEVDDDPDAIRAFHDNDNESSNNRKSHSNPTSVTSRTRRSDRQEATVYPSCSGTQQVGSTSSSRVGDVRRLCGGGGGGGDSSSESSSRAGGVGGGGSVGSVRRLTSEDRRCDTEDEEDYDNSTEVTAFIAVADIEVEPPPQPKKRATRSKSINSILSQAEENHLHELELKPRRICKECGCIRNSSSSKEGSFYKGVGEQEVNTDKDKKAAAPKQESLIKRAAKSIERTPSATESSDGDIQKDVSRKSSRSGGSTPYKTASQQKRKSDKRKQLPDGASPLAIEKHTECCCYCHQKRRSKGRSRTAQEGGDIDLITMVASPNAPCHNNHSAPPGHRPDHHPGMSKNSLSDGAIKTKTQTGKKQTTSLSETPAEQVTLPGTPESAQLKKMAWSKQNSADKLGPRSKATSGDKGRHKKDVRENMCESQRSLFTSNDSIVTVPVAPIVDPNAVFNFDDQEWAELALTNGNLPDAKSPSNSKLTNSIPTNNGTSSSSKPKVMDFSKKQPKSNSKESRTKRASKLLLSSRSSSFAGNSSSSKSSTKSSSSDLPRIPSGLRSAASSGCVTDMDDSDVTDHSTMTTMTSSSSIGDVTSLAMAGICDTLDPTAVCLQVHSDFYNDFCDFFDDEDVGVD